MDSGYGSEALDRPMKKRFHRHSPMQIQALEAAFKRCPHPDANERVRLGRELGLQSRQIKFWFQNRRTQRKAQKEKDDNAILRAQNEEIRLENMSFQEALSRVLCHNCGGTLVPPGASFNEEKLRLDNAHLREKLERVYRLVPGIFEAPVQKMIPISSLNVSVGGPQCPMGSLDQRSRIADEAAVAVAELIKLVHADDQLWTKVEIDGFEILKVATYERLFSRSRDMNMRREATRSSCVVMISAESLAKAFTDTSKWVELFPTIISKARTTDVISSGNRGIGSMQQINAEIQALSPIVPPRECSFLRHCRQIDPQTWAIVDVSITSSLSSRSCRKLPSGCVIQDMLDGSSKVIWVEHLEVERSPVPCLYNSLVEKGAAFGAQRWAAALSRACERAIFVDMPNCDSGWLCPREGKASMVKLSERMVRSFCGSVFAGDGDGWTKTLTGTDDAGVRIAMQQSVDPGQPNGVVLSAATSVWLPAAPEIVFSFLSNARNRSQWDVLSCGNLVQEVAHISTGHDATNGISLLRGLNVGESSMLILQESSTSSWGSSVVYAPIDVSAIKLVVNGHDPSRVPLLPSGFSIIPGEDELGGKKGSLVVIAFQILVSSLPSPKMNLESVATVNTLIGTTVRQIKAALNCN